MNRKCVPFRQFLMGIAMVLVLAIFVVALVQMARCLVERDESRRVNDRFLEYAREDGSQGMPIAVDLAALRAQNEDVVAWIYCPDTPINYPVVQGEDNLYYIDHLIDGQQNAAGTIFLDHRSGADLLDAYSVIHGHNLRDGSMFSSLVNYADQAYYDAHPVLYLLTLDGDFVIDLFAGFTTDSADGLYDLPLSEQMRGALIEERIAESDFAAQTQPTADDRLILLSTCSYAFADARYVLAGILREN